MIMIVIGTIAKDALMFMESLPAPTGHPTVTSNIKT